MPLRRIGELLSGGLASLDQVLELQEKALLASRAETERALGLLAAARRTLARTGALSLDDLTTLTKETVMSEPTRIIDQWREDLQPFVDRLFSPELKARMHETRADFAAAGHDQASVSREWEAIFQEARVLLAAGDESSPRACQLARRWAAMAGLFTRRDPEISAKVQAVWSDAGADPVVGARMPDVPDLFRFVGRVKAGMAARGAWAD